MGTYEPSERVLCVCMVQETDPYAVPVTSMDRHNRLAAGYANKSLRTRLPAPAGRRLTAARTNDSSCDTSKVVVPLSAPDRTTEPRGCSVRVGADLQERQQLARVTVPTDTPAGRLVLYRLPGRSPAGDGAARVAGDDRTAPPGRKSPTLVRGLLRMVGLRGRRRREFVDPRWSLPAVPREVNGTGSGWAA